MKSLNVGTLSKDNRLHFEAAASEALKVEGCRSTTANRRQWDQRQTSRRGKLISDIQKSNFYLFVYSLSKEHFGANYNTGVIFLKFVLCCNSDKFDSLMA